MPEKVILLSPMLLLIGLVLLGGLVGMVVLLANQKTRVVGVVLLALGLMTVVLAGSMLFFHRASVQNVQQMQMERAARAQQQALRQMEQARRLLDQGPIEQIVTEDNGTEDHAAGDDAAGDDGDAETTEANAGEEPAAEPTATTPTPIEETTDEAAVAEELTPAEVVSGDDMPSTDTAETEAADADITEADTTEATLTESDTGEPDTVEADMPEADTAEADAAEADAVEADTPPEDSATTEPVEMPPVEHAVSSVEPSPELPTGTDSRPAWVDAPPTRVGDVYQMAVTVGPFMSRLECDAKLPGVLHETVEQYASTAIGPMAVGRISLPRDFLTERLVAEQWQEAVQTSFGPMVQLHVLTRFDADVQHRIEQDVEAAWQRAVITERIWLVGVGMFFMLGFLAILFVGLKITRRPDSIGQPLSKTEPHADTRRLGPGRAAVLVVLVASAVAILTALLTHQSTGRVGRIEILLLVITLVALVVSVVIRRSLWPWILGYAVCAVVAVFATPADPASTMFVAALLGLIYTLILFLWRGSHSRPVPAADNAAERTGT